MNGRHDIDDLLSRAGIDPGTVPVLGTGTGTGQGWTSQADLADGGVIVRLLDEWGLLSGTRTNDGGWHLIACPWDPEHTVPGDNRAAVWAGGKFKCWHGHCAQRHLGEFRAWFEARLPDETGGLLTSLAQIEFEPVDPASVPVPVPAISAGANGEVTLWDPWDAQPPPAWPGGVLPAAFEDCLAALAERDGLDMGALAASYLTAASGAADKRTLLQPYAGSTWVVRPNLWTMLVATSGQRKTPILTFVLSRLKAAHDQRWRVFTRDMQRWRALPPALRHAAPAESALLAKDTTTEKLQDWMAGNPRGLLYARDELAALFDFGRYSAGAGAAERAFLLETQDGGPHTVGRVKGSTYIENCALAILGGTQQHRLAAFKDLASDGLLQRFGLLLMNEDRDGSQTGTAPIDTAVLDAAIDRLLQITAFSDYRTDAEGEAQIHDTERLGGQLARVGDYGEGFSGFARKLQGTHARVALILHLLDGGLEDTLAVDVVERAGRYAQFLGQHARTFYAGLAGAPEQKARVIASYLLRYAPKRVTAGTLRGSCRPCMKVHTLREIQDMVQPLVLGGWLTAERWTPDNNAWLVHPGLQTVFGRWLKPETDRAESEKHAMNQLGRYRGGVPSLTFLTGSGE